MYEQENNQESNLGGESHHPRIPEEAGKTQSDDQELQQTGHQVNEIAQRGDVQSKYDCGGNIEDDEKFQSGNSQQMGGPQLSNPYYYYWGSHPYMVNPICGNPSLVNPYWVNPYCNMVNPCWGNFQCSNPQCLHPQCINLQRCNIQEHQLENPNLEIQYQKNSQPQEEEILEENAQDSNAQGKDDQLENPNLESQHQESLQPEEDKTREANAQDSNAQGKDGEPNTSPSSGIGVSLYWMLALCVSVMSFLYYLYLRGLRINLLID